MGQIYRTTLNMLTKVGNVIKFKDDIQFPLTFEVELKPRSKDNYNYFDPIKVKVEIK